MTLELPETIDLASKAHPAGKKKANINRESEKKKKDLTAFTFLASVTPKARLDPDCPNVII